MVEGWADYLSVIASIIICLCAVIGGIWKYRIYLRERHKFPKANLSQKVTAIRLTDDKLCIHTSVRILNIGNVMLSLSSAEHTICQVQPIDDWLQERLKDGKDIYDAQRKEIQWPAIDNKKIDTSEHPWEIEAGEDDTYHFDLIIPSYVEAIQVYTYFANVEKIGLGWSVLGFYKVAEILQFGGELMSRSVIKAEKMEKQQAPKPTQKPTPVKETQQQPKPPPREK